MQRSILNVSVPKAMERQISSMAKNENTTKSELLRRAFRVYQFRKDWVRIRAVGEQTARKMGIETYEDVERIAG